jgi:hypothetical protein
MTKIAKPNKTIKVELQPAGRGLGIQTNSDNESDS